MGELRFSDGVTIDTGGDYRVEQKKDGLYVVGRGFMCPVETREEGDRMVKYLKGERDTP
jgi:hypothetical protein